MSTGLSDSTKKLFVSFKTFISIKFFKTNLFNQIFARNRSLVCCQLIVNSWIVDKFDCIDRVSNQQPKGRGRVCSSHWAIRYIFSINIITQSLSLFLNVLKLLFSRPVLWKFRWWTLWRRWHIQRCHCFRENEIQEYFHIQTWK